MEVYGADDNNVFALPSPSSLLRVARRG